METSATDWPASLTPISTDSSQTLRLLRQEKARRVMAGLRLDPVYCPKLMSRKQQQFLRTPHLEAFYGGAAGGGKSEALLAAAIQYIDQPRYAALLLRRTFSDLAKPGALIDRSKLWWSGTPARYNATEHKWTFPSGATLTFGYLASEGDVYQYQGSEFQFIGFDELTQFSEFQYTYLFSRLRRNMAVSAPLRMRAASNPGGVGHEWVKSRFIETDRSDVAVIRAKVADNPGMNVDEYIASLQQLDHLTRAQLLDGDWDVVANGDVFLREWFREYTCTPGGYHTDRPIAAESLWRFATVDLAVSERTSADYTAVAVWGAAQHQLLLLDMVRMQASAPDVLKRLHSIQSQWQLDFFAVEANGPQRGMVDMFRLDGILCKRLQPRGDKMARAATASVAFEAGQVFVRKTAAWWPALERELLVFPGGKNDDQVDAVSYGVRLALSAMPRREVVDAEEVAA